MVIAMTEQQNEALAADPEIKAMIDAGVHIGHTKSRRHPAMEPFIWTVRNNISIINVLKTKERLAVACQAIKAIGAKKGTILFVGTRPAAKKIIEEHARTLEMPYVTTRWIGGTLTNFKVIGKRIETMISLEQKKSTGEFDKYTKKERLQFEKEINRLNASFNGLRLLDRLPSLLFVVNTVHDAIACREARRMNIPVVALVDTNANIKDVHYPIPSNDDARPAITFMLDQIHQAFEDGKKEANSIKEVNTTTTESQP